jgi:hypothetical protein
MGQNRARKDTADLAAVRYFKIVFTEEHIREGRQVYGEN